MPISKILTFFDTHGISNASIGIAVSGGSDSIFLLHSLASIQLQLNLSISVLHVNYYLRGEDSNSDALFVERIASNLKLPFFKLDAPLTSETSGIEVKARDIRYAFFDKIRNEQQLDYIAIGHTSEDQIETVLFRVLRGSSLYGVSGMEEVREDTILRPLLNCTKDECNNWLTEHALTWCEDITNKDTQFTRNLIRHEIVPLLKKVNSNATQHILQFSQNCRSSYEELLLVGNETLQQLHLWEEETLFHCRKWDTFSESLRVALTAMLRKRKCSLSETHLSSMAKASEFRGKETLLPNGWRIYSSYNRTIFYHESTSPFLNNSSLSFKDNTTVTLNGLYSIPAHLHCEQGSICLIGTVNSELSKPLLKKLKKMGVPSKERNQFPLFSYKKSITPLTFR